MPRKTKSMFFNTTPVCLQQLVWQFAYGMCCPAKPLYDLMFVLDKQKNIPPIFLTFKVPTKELFPNGWCQEHNTFWPLYNPNPYKKGNPYFPAVGVCQDFLVWSTIADRFLELVSMSTLREMKTYRAVLHRNFVRQLNSRVEEWNRAMTSIWCFPQLSEPSNFPKITDCCPNTFSKANEWLITTVCQQLSECQYCSLTVLPVSL